ncbi:bifunctional histidinol-phosphatase/imidazoleglycerol-phosphate dehydratase HisB [bacterium]|nr:bifunctional histidinol-phosphatase/imidazoleglycerol-phosphate dehydratase HisB [bacterium]
MNAPRPILFVDRDGTLIVEPKPSLQIDSFEKLEFLPGVITALAKIHRELGYDLVLVSNQDGLGTESFPQEDFDGPQNLMLQIFAGEGVIFREVLIDPSFPHEDSPNRKPRLGLVEKYRLLPALKRSMMVGDRESDMEFAKNLGIEAIQLVETGAELPSDGIPPRKQCRDWNEIYEYLANRDRIASCARKTEETAIEGTLCLDGTGRYEISTGLGFFDHMLEQLARHGKFDLFLTCRGDLEVDEHHTIEDVGITLGEAFREALDNKRGIERYGAAEEPVSVKLPMDESRAEVLVDLSGRPALQWEVPFHRERIGDVPTEMFHHFFRSFVDASRSTLHITASGKNEHHLIEIVFKAFSRALRKAVSREKNARGIPTTKGVL